MSKLPASKPAKKPKVGKIRQLPVDLLGQSKRDLRTQFGALCFRTKDKKTEVLIIRSRRSKRWIIPKGWPMKNETPARAAATEAYQEAGVKGTIYDQCLGGYSYTKVMDRGQNLPVMVMVYPIKVKRLLTEYPERIQRSRKWVSLKKAAEKLSDPELAALVARFNPSDITS